MTCEIKSGHHPIQIKCSFPDANEAKRDFSVYFHSFDGSQNAVANCIFNGRNKCLAEEGFHATLEGLNAATVTVPDSFATKIGEFVCQKGDLPFIKNCQFPVLENSAASNSFKSEVGYGTTINVIPSFVTTEHSGNKDDDRLVIISAAVPAILVTIVLILFIIVFLRYKSKKSCERSNKPGTHKEIQPSKFDDECKISCFENQSKRNELVQSWLNGELTEVLEGSMPTKSQLLGNEVGAIFTEKQENTDKECALLNWKDSDSCSTRPTSMVSSFSAQSQVLISPQRTALLKKKKQKRSPIRFFSGLNDN